MADEAAAAAAEGPLVAVSFQRNALRKQKYLEAEPKALGITQIGLSAFHIICLSVFLAQGLSHSDTDIPLLVSSLVVVVAGSVAVAARGLHLPTLRGCLAMQILACFASVFSVVCNLFKVDRLPFYCWHYDNSTFDMCHKIVNTQAHLYTEAVLVQAALLAISATLAAYCCKVVNCCTPARKMMVITVQTPPVQQ